MENSTRYSGEILCPVRWSRALLLPAAGCPWCLVLHTHLDSTSQSPWGAGGASAGWGDGAGSGAELLVAGAGRSARATQKLNWGHETFAAWDVGEEAWVTEDSWRVVFHITSQSLLKRSNWACCAIFHNLSMQKMCNKWNYMKATVPVQHRRDRFFFFSKPRWAPPPTYGGCHEHSPLYRRQLGKSSGKATEKAEWNYFEGTSEMNVVRMWVLPPPQPLSSHAFTLWGKK